MNMMKFKILFLSIFLSCGASQQESVISAISHMPGDVVQKSMKKAFGSDYKIDRVSVESGIYLQQIIKSYNAHMKHAIMNWLKRELSQGASYNKELYYLVEQLDTVTTVKQAVVLLTRAISAHQAMVQDNPSYQAEDTWQERAYSMILLQCSVVLSNVARTQFLMILDEIHNSLQYWREQKLHPVEYFFHKSPIKWVKGKRQADEVAINIKKLEKLEYNIRVLLGRLTKHVYVFDLEGNLTTSYAWIDNLLSILSSVGLGQEIKKDQGRFDKTAEVLHFKLTTVSYLKNTILSKVESAIKPGHLARNWLKYSAAFTAAYFARNYYLQNTQWASKNISPNALLGYVVQGQEYMKEYVVSPLQDTLKAIFVGRMGPEEQEKNIELSRAELKKAVEKLSQVNKVGWLGWALGAEPGMVEGKPLSQDRIDLILAEEKKGNLIPLKELLFDVNKGLVALTWSEGLAPLVQIALSYIDLLGYHGAKSLAEELRVTKNLAKLAPSMIIAGFGIVGLSKLYRTAMSRDYTPIRLGLLDINSLFIESTTPLNDHDYGKLIYLLQGLKLQAMRYLTLADMRNDFLTDLAKLESNKFNVETKRSIIQNMFMKYPFLSLNAKSA